jgi:hypothetical protein
MSNNENLRARVSKLAAEAGRENNPDKYIQALHMLRQLDEKNSSAEDVLLWLQITRDYANLMALMGDPEGARKIIIWGDFTAEKIRVALPLQEKIALDRQIDEADNKSGRGRMVG